MFSPKNDKTDKGIRSAYMTMIEEGAKEDVEKLQQLSSEIDATEYTFGEIAHTASDYIEFSLKDDEEKDIKSKAILDFLEYSKEFLETHPR